MKDGESDPGAANVTAGLPSTSGHPANRPLGDGVSRVTCHLCGSFIIAWHFLTTIPLSRAHHEPTAPELAASMAWYPVVGLLIGGGLSAVDFGLTTMFSTVVVNVLLIVLLVLFTRGLHQDGLADTLDGLAGGRTPAERLSIMRDPRIGAIGATGLFLSLILRYAGLMALPAELRFPAVLCMPAVGRWAMVTLAWISPYARSEGGLAAPFLTHLSWRHAAISTGVLTMALAGGFGAVGACLILLAGALIVLVGWWACRSWFGGITGDTLGAVNEAMEILFLILVPLLLRLP
ncbi:adenosylcobinamide-GDP ribazoletransferase [Candidatus Nitrospira nitrificans]|uniref:Adenosylcobinamide-GDP ribazoletransferase n=1 Tax=Candidatus Nitrospira nitrificans TaxID=1742973 RepID=A0A0S4LN68_9BACT|nr:adenosylcobinamide-GDP ribazoletransferase [Candidatus Nitrospira nitrificans]CUS39031.1 Cobalamin synthase [Candidatus Nitrospira nitrificans]